MLRIYLGGDLKFNPCSFIGDYPPTPTPTQHKKETQPYNGGTLQRCRVSDLCIGQHLQNIREMERKRLTASGCFAGVSARSRRHLQTLFKGN